MYVRHFGFSARPFPTDPSGPAVFVGPTVVVAIASLQAILQEPGSVAVVRGPAGAGKSTLVSRTLASTSTHCVAVTISRTQTDGFLLNHLLSELGVDSPPAGAFRQFGALRSRIAAINADGGHVVVVVEDATRLAAESLAQLEELTAVETGEGMGTNIFLMGDERIDEALAAAPLAELKRRIARQHDVVPMSVTELRGYLRHCFRIAGADFDQLFDADAPELLHFLCGGVPRPTNNLVESSLSAATAANKDHVDSALIEMVARNEYGLSTDGYQSPQAPTIAVVADAEPPDLIHDTLPELEILAPDMEVLDQAMTEAADAEPSEIPVLQPAVTTTRPAPPLDVEIPEITLDHAIDRSLQANAGSTVSNDVPAELSLVESAVLDPEDVESELADAEADAADSEPTPAPIEDQIATSMTDTLRALSSTRPVGHVNGAADDAAAEKRGLFSRFRRS